MSGRLPCVVPFCRRTRGDRKGDPVARYDAWMCGTHWRLVDRRTRRLHRKAQRRFDEVRTTQALAVCRWLFERGRRQAIERALP